MKTAIDNNGVQVEVSDDTVVKTIDGKHYLLTDEEVQNLQELYSTWENNASIRANNLSSSNRKAAYINEADPLFFKFQRGEVTQQEWLDKIQEIKIRFPKVE